MTGLVAASCSTVGESSQLESPDLPFVADGSPTPAEEEDNGGVLVPVEPSGEDPAGDGSTSPSTTGPTQPTTTRGEPNPGRTPLSAPPTSPTTTPPTTAAPTTGAPSTDAPTTAAPTTAAPTTGAPTTAAPTSGPTTTPPTTAAPTTAPPTTASPAPETNVDAWGYIGTPWAPNNLGNNPLSGNRRFSHRFTAKHSGNMVAWQNFMTANHGGRTAYAKGDGGLVGLTVHPDKNGMPDESVVLGQTTWDPVVSNGMANGDENAHTKNHSVYYATKTWASPVALVAGQTYHVVYTNIASDPANNYLSVNDAYSHSNSRNSIGPSVEDWGLTVDWGRGKGWEESTQREAHSTQSGRYDPTVVIHMADPAKNFGNSTITSIEAYPVSGSSAVRQVFTQDQTVVVDRLSLFASGSGTMRAELTQGNNVVGSWTVAFNNSERDFELIDTGNVTLAAGQSYALTFTAESGSFTMTGTRDGSLQNGNPFAAGGGWHNSHAQSTSGGSWENIDRSDTSQNRYDLTGVAFRTVG